jgi:predicted negative regulator of RcsB-dependent stress response
MPDFMDTYHNEDEQVAAIKKWWQQNAKSVLLGLALGIGLVVGWQAWQTHHLNQGMAASAAFAQLQKTLEAEQAEPIITAAEQVIENYPSTVYAVLAARHAAKHAYQQGNKEAARTYLERALQATDDTVLQTLIRVQLAALLIDLQQWAAAETALQLAADDDIFAAEVAALRGDLAYQQGDTATAYTAYQEAATLGASGLLDLKLAELRPAVEQGVE